MKNRILLGALIAIAFATSSTAALAQEQVIKIGSHLPLTASLARSGNATLDGIQVAVEEANKKYDGEYQFKLIVADDESSPTKAISAVEKLASQGVVAITGGYASSIVGPASATAHDLGIPYITSGGVAKGLSQRGYDGFFRINNIAGYAKAVVGYIHMLGGDTVSVLYNKSSPSTIGMAEIMKSRLSKDGIKVFMHAFGKGFGSFTPLLNRIRLQERPDIIAMIGYESDYVHILRSAKVLKPDVNLVAGWGLATVRMNKEFNDLVQGVAGTALLPYPVHFTNAAAKEFAQDFKQMHGHLPDYLGLYGYVQTQLLIQAIVNVAESGDITGERIAQALHAIDAETLLGRVAFNEDGDNPYFVHHMAQHQGDRIEIVWPESAATAEVMLPARPW